MAIAPNSSRTIRYHAVRLPSHGQIWTEKRKLTEILGRNPFGVLLESRKNLFDDICVCDCYGNTYGLFLISFDSKSDIKMVLVW